MLFLGLMHRSVTMRINRDACRKAPSRRIPSTVRVNLHRRKVQFRTPPVSGDCQCRNIECSHTVRLLTLTLLANATRAQGQEVSFPWSISASFFPFSHSSVPHSKSRVQLKLRSTEEDPLRAGFETTKSTLCCSLSSTTRHCLSP